MRPSPTVGVLGYGEAGTVIARTCQEGGSDVVVTNRSPDRLEERLADDPIDVARSPAAVAATSDVVISCVWPATAEAVAADAVEGFDDDRMRYYYDLNSIAPKTTRSIDDLVRRNNGIFSKGTIMDSAAREGANMRLTISGKDRDPVAEYLTAVGFQVEDLGDNVIRPAALKMCRSIITKGIRAVLVEALLTAMAYDVEADTMQDVAAAFNKRDFEQWFPGAIEGTPTHAERRMGEAQEMLATALEAGVRSPTIEATLDFHRIVHEEEITGNSYREILSDIASHYSR